MQGICFKEIMFPPIVEQQKTETRRIALRGEVTDINILHAMPRYRVNEIVYLKEPYFLNTAGIPVYKYLNEDWVKKCEKLHIPLTWKSKLYMPEKYARFFIKIREVNMSRLHTIDNNSALAEGVEFMVTARGLYYKDYLSGEFRKDIDARESFRSLFAWIHGWEIWRENPWVFVYKFRLLEKGEAQGKGLRAQSAEGSKLQ